MKNVTYLRHRVELVEVQSSLALSLLPVACGSLPHMPLIAIVCNLKLIPHNRKGSMCIKWRKRRTVTSALAVQAKFLEYRWRNQVTGLPAAISYLKTTPPTSAYLSYGLPLCGSSASCWRADPTCA